MIAGFVKRYAKAAPPHQTNNTALQPAWRDDGWFDASEEERRKLEWGASVEKIMNHSSGVGFRPCTLETGG